MIHPMTGIAFATTTSGVITALASLVTALSLILTAFGVLLPILRGTKKTAQEVRDVHTIVNSQRTDMLRYNAALMKALTEAGISIPDDQSLTLSQQTVASDDRLTFKTAQDAKAVTAAEAVAAVAQRLQDTKDASASV